MCSAVTVAIALGLLLLIPVGVFAWLAFIASVKKHRDNSSPGDEGRRDDAGLTAFERAHLWQVMTSGFAGQSDSKLRKLAARARVSLLLSACIGVAIVLLLLYRTSAHCS